MSAGSKQAAVDAKAARQGVVEQRAGGGMKKQAKPIVVEWRWPECAIKAWREWHKRASYASIEVAEAAMENFRRKHPRAEFRLRPHNEGVEPRKNEA